MGTVKKTHCLHGHARTTDNVSDNGSCRECLRIRAKSRYQTPEYNARRAAEMKVYYAALTPEKRARRRELDALWRANNPQHKERDRLRRLGRAEIESARARNGHLKRKYGITSSDVEAMVASQNGVCAICGTREPRGKTNKWNVDHCHASGSVRGLLCHKCNVGLGRFADNPALLRRAANYLEAIEGRQ